ncbi:MAG: hypothetical protein P8X97_06775 [Candidatus Bathyarchaeota archaeon]
MPGKRMRIEISNNGDRYTIIFEGQITREKALRLLDLVELLGGMSAVNDKKDHFTSEVSKIDKVRLVAEKNFPVTWFSSKELKAVYEQEYNEPIRLSTASTYLSRLSDRGFFIKKYVSNHLRYRILTAISNYNVNKK